MSPEEIVAVARARFDTVRFWAKYVPEADAFFAWLLELLKGEVKPAAPAAAATRPAKKKAGRGRRG